MLNIGGRNAVKIVVFDDNLKDRENLVRILNEWGNMTGHQDLILRKFDKITDLENSLNEESFPDLFFLDIMTPERANAGFVLAEKIHAMNPSANIVFATNSPEYWSSAFEIFALHYLMKPLQAEKIFALMNYIYDSPSKRTPAATTLPGMGQEEVIEYDRILYLEAQTSSHRAYAYLTDGTSREINLSRMSFSDLQEKYLNHDFARCHRGIIVNLNYVVKYTNVAVALRNLPRELDIGKQYREEFVNKMIDHQKGLRKL